jgi:hypothetical protein
MEEKSSATSSALHQSLLSSTTLSQHGRKQPLLKMKELCIINPLDQPLGVAAVSKQVEYRQSFPPTNVSSSSKVQSLSESDDDSTFEYHGKGGVKKAKAAAMKTSRMTLSTASSSSILSSHHHTNSSNSSGPNEENDGNSTSSSTMLSPLPVLNLYCSPCVPKTKASAHSSCVVRSTSGAFREPYTFNRCTMAVLI